MIAYITGVLVTLGPLRGSARLVWEAQLNPAAACRWPNYGVDEKYTTSGGQGPPQGCQG